MTDLFLSIFMLAGLALAGFSILVWRKGDRKRAVLMLVAALVAFANAAIWLIPSP